MSETTQMARHAALVDKMSTALGVDLEESVLRAQLRPDTLVDAVLSCTNCTNPGACETWLATRDGVEQQPPGYCRNTGLFAALKAGETA